MLRNIVPLTVLLAMACSSGDENTRNTLQTASGKPVIYQVMTRLFGNKHTTNKPWGTIEDNGVGKFNDFSDRALEGIRELGATHIWYTGVPHHAVIRDYTGFGISNDDPDVVKGRAGSPYAVKDYYSVNPDLAVEPDKRLEEFRALVARTHRHGMKVIIDIVPNHVARRYESLDKPEGVSDFGAADDPSVEWSRDNNFYYVVGEDFRVPRATAGYRPLGGEAHPLADGLFEESPAKWTGNGARVAQPDANDWYETVKINYGVRPGGSYAFPRLPVDYANRDVAAHFRYWADKDVPDSWLKFRDIALYWLELGVDGFRFDMAEMVPVEFWSFLNAAIKSRNSQAVSIAEVYQPDLYRDYLHLGKMDYLYDKVGFYDTVKQIMQGTGSTDDLHPVQDAVSDIASHMLHFLENHDEQRIASPEFAGDASKGKPAMVVSALISPSPTMVYFGQDVGEPGNGDAGFGTASRTTIFDYWGVPAHQRWMNGGRFDGGGLSASESALREFYVRLLTLGATSPAMHGEYREIHSINRAEADGYDERLFAFIRWKDDERLIVVSNFDAEREYRLTLALPAEVIREWRLAPGVHELTDQLNIDSSSKLSVGADGAGFDVTLAPLQSVVFRVEQ